LFTFFLPPPGASFYVGILVIGYTIYKQTYPRVPMYFLIVGGALVFMNFHPANFPNINATALGILNGYLVFLCFILLLKRTITIREIENALRIYSYSFIIFILYVIYSGNADFVSGRAEIIGMDQNNLATVSNIALVYFVLSALFQKWGARKLLYIGLPFILLYVIIGSGSRGRILSLPVTLFLCLIAIRKSLGFKKTLTFFILTSILVLLSFYFISENEYLYQRFMGTLDGSIDPTSGRLDILKASLTVVSDAPLIGEGPTKFYQNINLRLRGTDGIKAAHNTYVYLWGTLGLLMGSLIILFMIYPAVKLFSVSSQDRKYILALAPLIVILVAFLSLDLIQRKWVWLILVLSYLSLFGYRRSGFKER